jgi:hypothetical protein
MSSWTVRRLNFNAMPWTRTGVVVEIAGMPVASETDRHGNRGFCF